MPQDLYTPKTVPVAETALRSRIDLLRCRAQLAEIVGWKVALNSPAVQRHLGLSGPLIDCLTQATVRSQEEPISLAPGRQYLVEAEPFLTLACDLPLNPSLRDCHDAIGQVGLAIEILDFTPGPLPLESILANNTYHYAAILGPTAAPGAIPTTDELTLCLRVGNLAERLIDHSLVVGEFPDVLIFVARLADGAGRRLLKDDVVLCGSLNSATPVKAGETISAQLDPFGTLCLATIPVDAGPPRHGGTQ
ncbi:MAG: hypothetical protein IH973_12910 [Myxococcales bacterium]|nr:hypothetical protein [Myxococcales bacterium]